MSSDLGLDVGVGFFQAGKEHGMNKCVGKGMEPTMVYKRSKVRLKHRVHVRGETRKEGGWARLMLRLTEHLLCVRHQPQEVWNTIIPFSM